MEKIGQFLLELFYKILGGIPKALGGFWGWAASLVIKLFVKEVKQEIADKKTFEEKKEAEFEKIDADMTEYDSRIEEIKKSDKTDEEKNAEIIAAFLDRKS